jgi:4'-phosphopantetheinyl transferase
MDAPGDVQVWEVDLRDLPWAVCQALLSPAERARAEAMATSVLQRRTGAARALLRCVLGRYLGLRPLDVIFTVEAHGKPRLHACHGSTLQFNLSHCEDRALIAISAHAAVGIDIERLRELPDWRELGRLVFSNRDQDHLQRLPAEAGWRAFIELWTRKEAVLKATGEGLISPSLLRLDVYAEDSSPRPIVCSDAENWWTMCRLTVGGEYAACLAVQGHLGRLQRFESSTNMLEDLIGA